MKYRVGPTPTWFGGKDRSDGFPPGTVVEVTDPTPNAIGDVWAHLVDSVGEALHGRGGGVPDRPLRCQHGRIALSCLEPIEDDIVRPRSPVRWKYRVGPNPTWDDGAEKNQRFPPGTVVTVTVPTPDRYGYVYARRVGPNGNPVPGPGGHIALSCLEPIEDKRQRVGMAEMGRAVRVVMAEMGRAVEALNVERLQEALAAAEKAAAEGDALRAKVEALTVRWETEAAQRGPGDMLYTDGVVAMLRAALNVDQLNNDTIGDAQ